MPLAGGVPRRETWAISEDATNWYALGDSAVTPGDGRAAVIFDARCTEHSTAHVCIRRELADRKFCAGGAPRMRADRAVTAMSMVPTSVAAGTRIWLAAVAADMRKGFTGLSALVQNALAGNPFCGHLLVFRGRRGDPAICPNSCGGTARACVCCGQTAGARALHLAASTEWKRIAQCGATLDAARRI